MDVKTTKPIVSIIIPCYNHRNFLWECLFSLKKQKTTFSFEIIVVDDASTDNPKPVCDYFGARYFRLEKSNANVARNFGFTQAKGEIIVWFDADNTWKIDGLQRLVEPLLTNQPTNIDVTYSRFSLIGDTDRYRYSAYNRMQYTYEDLKMGSCIDTASAIKRSALTPEPWDALLIRNEDWDYHLNNMKRGVNYHFIDQELFNYRLAARNQLRKYHNKKHLDDSTQYLQQKYQLDTASNAEITIGAPTIGRYFCVDEWFRAIEGLDYPKEKLNLQIYDQSNNKHFFDTYLLPFANRIKQHINGVHIKTNHTPKIMGSLDSLDSKDRPDRYIHIVDMMQYFVDNLTTPYLFILEDDTDCPPDTLHKFKKSLNSDPDCVAVQGVERSRITKYSIGAWAFNEQREVLNLFPVSQSDGVVRIGAGGFFCLLLKGSWYKQNYRFRLRQDLPEDHSKGGPDITHGWDLLIRGKKFFMDWSVNCNHFALAQDGQVYILSPNSYSEPDSIFYKQYHPFKYNIAPKSVLTKDKMPIFPCYDNIQQLQIDAQSISIPLKTNEPYKISQQYSNAIREENYYSLIIHSITEIQEIEKIIDSFSFIKQIILLPKNPSAYQKLRQHNWPTNTSLFQPSSLAENITKALNWSDYCPMIVHAGVQIINKNQHLFLPSMLNMAISEFGSIFDQKIIDWYSMKNIQPFISFESFSERGVVSLLFVTIPKHTKGFIHLEPRLGDNLPLLEWQLSRQLWQLEIPIAFGSYLNKQMSNRPNQFYFHLGVLAGLEIPIKNILRFYKRTVRYRFRTTSYQTLLFWEGVIFDFILRIIAPNKRRQYPSPSEKEATS